MTTTHEPATPATHDDRSDPPASLFERIGGRAGLERIVPDVVDLHYVNPVVGARFRAAGTPREELTRLAIEFFATGLSGEATYQGRSMSEAHAGMGIRDEEFNAVLDDILLALDGHGIGAQEQAELLFIAYGMKGDIVTRTGRESDDREISGRQLVFEPDDGTDGGTQLGQVVPILAGLIGRVSPEDLDRPTPCADWTLRDLLNHVIGGARMFAGAFAGDPLQDISGHLPDVVGDDPMNAFGRAAAEFGAATQLPGAMERIFPLPFGTMTGRTFLRFAAFDLLVHSWDIATTIGAKVEVSSELVTEIEAFARQVLAEGRDPVNFAPAAPVPTRATPLERLVALSGRRG